MGRATGVYIEIHEDSEHAGTRAVLRKIPSGDDPEAFDVHSNGDIYLSNGDDAKATVLHPKSGRIVAQIPVGLEPEGVAVTGREAGYRHQRIHQHASYH